MSWKCDNIEWLDIELTSFCNISCSGCFRTLSKYTDNILNKELLSLDLIQKRFRKELFPSIRIVNFCGSVDEPCSHPEFFGIIEHFHDWGHINIATNGSLRTPSWWERLAKSLPPSHQVTFGIDGTDETSEIYRRGSSFKKVEQNYKAFIAAGGRATWQFIVFEHNEHQHEEAKQKAEAEGFINFKTIYSHRKDLKTNTGVAKHVKKKIEQTPTIECKYLKQQRIFINHNGNVIPCCHLNSEMLEWNVGRDNITRFGEIVNQNMGVMATNLEYNDIDEIIEGDFFQDIVDSWPGLEIPKCVSTCKKKNHDTFIKEKL